MSEFTIDDLRADFAPAQATANVCLDGKLLAEIERLEAELPAVEEADNGENRSPQAPVLADRIFELYEQAKAKERLFTFTALSAKAWSDLVSDHPPSKAQRQEGYDTNPDVFPFEAMALTCDPKLSPDDFRWIKETVSPAQFDRIWLTCRAVHQVVNGPKAQASDTATRLATVPRSRTAPKGESPGPSSSDE